MGNFIYKAIDKAVNAESPDKFCEALEQCRNALSSVFVNKTAFMERLKEALEVKTGYLKYCENETGVFKRLMPDVYIYEDMGPYLAYSSFKISLCSNIMELKEQIDEIVDFFENKISEPKTDRLTLDEITDILDLVQRKYGLISTVTYDRELEIYLFNKSHICYDSFLLTYKNIHTGALLNKWMLFSFAPCMNFFVCNKYFVFLHELGHILYNAYKNTAEKTPMLFDEMTMVLGLPFLDDENRRSELFADLFSVSAMNNTRYLEYNPYKNVLSSKVRELLELYFSMLVSRVDVNNYIYREEKQILH